jgi:uncharacterized membrane protein
VTVDTAAISAWATLGNEWRLELGWMWVNFALAVLPGLGALALHHWRHHLGPLRWAALAAVVLFLPNAPYVVTDLIHLGPSVATAPRRLDVVAGVLPSFVLLIGSGVLSYAYSLHVLRRELRARGWSRRRRVAAEAAVDALCAVGLALGRISRLNSWDVLDPSRLLQGLRTLTFDPRSVGLALIIVVLAGVGVDWLASGAAHSLRSRLRPH